jgi:hypothetical protein
MDGFIQFIIGCTFGSVCYIGYLVIKIREEIRGKKR